MASPAQIDANRANAQRSTGPSSVEGKAATRFNAMKHGLDAASLVIPGEDPEQLANLTADFYQELCPVGALETALVDSAIRAEWFRRRYAAVEAQLWETLLRNMQDPNATHGDAFYKDAAGRNTLGKLHRRQQAVAREYDKAIADLRRLQEDRFAYEDSLAEPAAVLAPALAPQPPIANPAPVQPARHQPPTPGKPWVGSEPLSWRL